MIPLRQKDYISHRYYTEEMTLVIGSEKIETASVLSNTVAGLAEEYGYKTTGEKRRLQEGVLYYITEAEQGGENELSTNE